MPDDETSFSESAAQATLSVAVSNTSLIDEDLGTPCGYMHLPYKGIKHAPCHMHYTYLNTFCRNIPATYRQYCSLSLERQWYIYNIIAEYCPEAVRDKACPKPLVALHMALQQHDSTGLTSMATTATDHLSTTPTLTTSTPVFPLAVCSTSGLTAPPAKKAHLCTKCKQPGHNARSCGKGSS